jgi:bacterioferritin-associated ferredoxin
MSRDEIYREIDRVSEYLPDQPQLIPDDELICECNCVSAATIRKEFAKSKHVDLGLLKRKYLLGSGCATCLKAKDEWLNRLF